MRWARRRPAAAGLLVSLVLLIVGSTAGAMWLSKQGALARARQQQTDQEVRSLVAHERGLLEEAWEAADVSRLTQVGAEATRAVDIARSGNASAAVLGAAESLRSEAAERLERAKKDRAFLEAVLDVSPPPETGLFSQHGASRVLMLALPTAEEQYAAAFRAWGLDVDLAEESEVVQRISQEPRVVVEDVIAALDSWMLERKRLKRPEHEWRHLARVAEALDGNDRNQRLRALLVEGQPLRAEDSAWLLGVREQLDPGQEPPLTVLLLARNCVAVGDPAGAEALLRRAAASRPGQLVLLRAMVALVESSRPAEAIGYFRAARSQRRNLGINLGNELIRAGRAGEAEEVLRDVVQQQPENPGFRFYLGVSLYAQGKSAAAAEEFRRAAALETDFAEAFCNLGAALTELKKPTEAAAALRKAIELEPALAASYVNMGRCLMESCRFDEASSSLATAADLLPAGLREQVRPMLQQCERLEALEARLPAILSGTEKPASPTERTDFARLCSLEKRNATAARLFADAFTSEPQLADEPGCRYEAACAAALAGCGREDADAGNEADRAYWREQARRWLRTDLHLLSAASLGEAPARHVARRTLLGWRGDPDLAGLRDPDSLETLAAAEQGECLTIWSDVDTLLARLQDRP